MSKLLSLLSRGARQGALAGLALGLFASTAAAQTAVVEAVQMPAWVERGGEKIPLAPGTALRPRDDLRTGSGARLYMKLAEGSIVKLGENGSLRLLDLARERRNFVRGAMEVLEGAFRFTTDVLNPRAKRDINIKLVTVTAGIRGTDLWGRSRSDEQIVCLIEGRIEVGALGEQPLTMDQPRQFYQRVKGQAQPVSLVTTEQLATWAAETEIAAGRGATRRGGRWKLTLATLDTQEAALKVYDDLRNNGYAAQIRPVAQDAALTYRIELRSLPSQIEAAALARQLEGRFGMKGASVSR